MYEEPPHEPLYRDSPEHLELLKSVAMLNNMLTDTWDSKEHKMVPGALTRLQHLEFLLLWLTRGVWALVSLVTGGLISLVTSLLTAHMTGGKP
jgi:hypothetical protein